VQPGHATRCPSARPETPLPSASTRPTTWCPGTSGLRRTGRSPVTTCRSVRQAAHACTRIRTCPAPGSGSGHSSSASGARANAPGSRKTCARMLDLQVPGAPLVQLAEELSAMALASLAVISPARARSRGMGPTAAACNLHDFSTHRSEVRPCTHATCYFAAPRCSRPV
jgi:hypothetical protein